MAEGEILWFDNARGYGFIRPDGGGPDVYVHLSQIEGEEKTLMNGEPVNFEISEGEKRATGESRPPAGRKDFLKGSRRPSGPRR